MKLFNWVCVLLAAYILAFASLYAFAHRAFAPNATSSVNTPLEANAAELGPSASRYQLDAGASKFMAHASRSGFLWFKGHGHHIAVRDFTGEAVFDSDSLAHSSLP